MTDLESLPQTEGGGAEASDGVDGEWRCQQCHESVAADAVAGEGKEEAGDEGLLLGESWMDLTGPPAGASNRSDAVDRRCHKTTHELVEEHSKVMEIVGQDGSTGQQSLAYPLCESCTLRVLKELASARDLAREECELYERALLELEGEGDGGDDGASPGGMADLDQRLRTAEEEESGLMKRLATIEAERASIKEEMAELQTRSSALDERHATYWGDFNRLQLRLGNSEKDSLRRKIDVAAQQLEALNKTNVINDAFFISHRDVFGTINGFRLGSIQSQPVEWDEINAAWGQTMLLLQTLSTNCDFEFKKYRLAPMGSFSRIIKKDDNKTVYDLYCPSDIGFGRLFGYGTFDKGMGAFLECVQELQNFVQQVDPSFSPPYRIEEDRIEELSVKLQFNTYEKWTKALKYMLTDIKWLVASRIQ